MNRYKVSYITKSYGDLIHVVVNANSKEEARELVSNEYWDVDRVDYIYEF